MKKLILLLSLFSLSSCKTPCNESELVKQTSDKLAVIWECKNPEALNAWIERIASRVGVCKEVSDSNKKEGIIANLVCPALAKGAQRLMFKAVPIEAQCNPDKVGAGAAAAFEMACELIPY